MGHEFVQPNGKLTWRFPRTFWVANVAELFERAAFYGMFIALVLYLTRMVGFNDVEAGYVAACFSSVLYLLPTFMGAMADKIGFRPALILAFALLSVGYLLLGAAPEAGRAASDMPVVKSVAIVSLVLIMFGGAIVKPVISGTVAKCSDEAHRARAFSIFYWVVNIGAFTGKTVAAPLRTGCTLPYVGRLEFGLQYINFYAAVMAFLALCWVALFYRNVDTKGTGKTASEVMAGLLKVCRNIRFMALILIVAGFWVVQGQLYATMTKYILRLLGEGAKPEWLANINPAVVILCVVPITHLIRKFKPENAIGIGLFIVPFSALSIALSPTVESFAGRSVSVFGLFSLHPITLMVIIGIGLQGLGECFLSPKFLEYASKQAPAGEVGLYMGYQHLTTFFAWALGFSLSGHLLDRFCPDPEKLSTDLYAQWRAAIETGSPMPEAYAHAHYIWFIFAGIGVTAFLALWVFKFVTDWTDRGKLRRPA
jgi:dipeptide/tripeptide permease